jgi:hypothetical protein
LNDSKCQHVYNFIKEQIKAKVVKEIVDSLSFEVKSSAIDNVEIQNMEANRILSLTSSSYDVENLEHPTPTTVENPLTKTSKKNKERRRSLDNDKIFTKSFYKAEDKMKTEEDEEKNELMLSAEDRPITPPDNKTMKKWGYTMYENERFPESKEEDDEDSFLKSVDNVEKITNKIHNKLHKWKVKFLSN